MEREGKTFSGSTRSNRQTLSSMSSHCYHSEYCTHSYLTIAASSTKRGKYLSDQRKNGSILEVTAASVTRFSEVSASVSLCWLESQICRNNTLDLIIQRSMYLDYQPILCLWNILHPFHPLVAHVPRTSPEVPTGRRGMLLENRITRPELLKMEHEISRSWLKGILHSESGIWLSHDIRPLSSRVNFDITTSCSVAKCISSSSSPPSSRSFPLHTLSTFTLRVHRLAVSLKISPKTPSS